LSEPARIGLSGNLRLVCASHPERGTFLAEQSFSAPIHLSKSYWDGETLLVNVVNQTAGIFGGDEITTHVEVGAGARVLLSSPSAARFHPSHGREARLRQTFAIRAGGSLDVFPEISIPQRDSRSFQQTTIRVDHGGELLYLETLAPGRVASVESFAFARYAWSTDVHLAGRLVHRERANLAPHDASTAALRTIFPASYYAGILVISPSSPDWSSDFPHAIAKVFDHLPAKVAASKLNGGGWSIRVLTADSVTLRKCISKLREAIYGRLGRRMPDARRTIYDHASDENHNR
jgi:urease accessory protein